MQITTRCLDAVERTPRMCSWLSPTVMTCTWLLSHGLFRKIS